MALESNGRRDSPGGRWLRRRVQLHRQFSQLAERSTRRRKNLPDLEANQNSSTHEHQDAHHSGLRPRAKTERGLWDTRSKQEVQVAGTQWSRDIFLGASSGGGGVMTKVGGLVFCG